MNTPIPLYQGDTLLYGKKPRDLFSFLTSFGTDSPAVHVEIYAGGGMSLASRNGIGVNLYTYREDQLIAVLRPPKEYDFDAALKWFKEKAQGLPYGWLDLLRWIGPGWLNIKTKGLICSEFKALFDMHAGMYPFNGNFPAESIDPGDFLKVKVLRWSWVDKSVLEFFDLTSYA